MATFTRCTYADGEQICISASGHRGRHALRDKSVLEDFEKRVAEIKEKPVESISTSEGEVAVVEPEGPVVSVVTKEDDLLVPVMGPKPDEATASAWAPTEGDFISLKGKAYLPARRRIQWMRGLPVPHPDWTIDTEIVQHEAGKLTKPGSVGVGRVEGGYAVVRANIFSEDGRLIATGLKSEYSENFADYLEKAETGAIARALAVAGYGTESALDLDEGVAEGRIADAPVEVPSLRPSAVPGVGRGGKTDGASVAQIRAVAALTKQLDMERTTLVSVMENVFDTTIGPVPNDEAAASHMIADFLSKQSGEAVGRLIATLQAAEDEDNDEALAAALIPDDIGAK